ncbi:MAG TPA: type IVB secretion system protein IcmH/DotU [Pseudomonadales bacterium]|nr:type IVB secretion system protein IcmH/DotU [Pseudomonadales bacterium]
METAEKTSRYPGFNKLVERTVILPNPGRNYQAVTPESVQAANVPALHDPIKIENALNPILAIAYGIVTLLARIRQCGQEHDARSLHSELIASLKKFDADCKNRGIKQEQNLVARYVLCTALDEAVLMTPWGADSGWAQRSLLALFHQETFGGEKFFVILDKLLERPSENIALLELIYICLSLGFQGKYHLMERGADQLENIREQLFQSLIRLRGAPPRELSLRWRGAETPQRLIRFVPLWVVASVIAASLCVVFAVMRGTMHWSSSATVEQLEHISAKHIQ